MSETITPGAPRAGGLYGFENAARPVTSRGFETNARLPYRIVKLFAGHTYTGAKAGYLTGDQFPALTPESRIYSAPLFGREDDFEVGLEV